MTGIRRALLVAAAVGAVGLVAAPRTARACVPLSCTPLQVAPDRGDVEIPAGAPALALWPDKAPDGEDPEPVDLALMTADGQAVTTTVMADPTLPGAFLLLPYAPLQAGQSYSLTYATTCGGDAPAPRQNAISVGAATDLPTSIGEVTVTPLTAEINEYEIPPCTGKALAAQAMLTLEPSAELLPFLPLTRFTTVVDGEVWVESFYGQSQGRLGPARRHHDRLFAVCDPENATELTDLGLSVGSHEVELRAHVAGAESDPEPVRFTVELRCEVPDGGPSADGGSDGGSPDDDASGDAGADGGSGGGGGGCSTGGPAAHGGATAGALLLLTALLLPRLRRRNR